MTTSGGQAQRYDVANQRLLTPWNVGTSLNGADITPDGSTLYVAESQLSGSQGVLHKVNLDDGSVTNITYSLGPYEGGTWDVAVANNGKAFFSTSIGVSGSVPFRQLDLNTGAVTTRTDTHGSGGGGYVRGNTHIDRSADGSQMFLAEPDVSSGPITTYDSASDTFPHHAETQAYYYDAISAVSRDGSLIATELGYGPAFFYGVSIMDRNFHSVRTLGTNFNGGLAFDPSRDLFYVADASAGQVVAFDTNTWEERFRVSIGEGIPASTPFGSGEMTVSSDGSELFLSTPSGVRMIDLPASTGVASRLDVSGFPSFISSGTPGTVTVTARDPAGTIDTGFSGTVHLSSTDPSAVLDDDYTFTPDDQGIHTFNATLLSGGTFSLTATDDADGLSGSQSNIRVHTDPVSLIPVTNRRALVYDAQRGLLYLTTDDGLVQRWDVNTQTLLAPWKVGASINGADITSDGQFLYTTEGVRGATQGMVHKINLDDGTVTNLFWDLGFYEGGGWGLSIASNGKALVDSRFEGSGWVKLRQIDLATDTITIRDDAPGIIRGQIPQDTHIRRGGDRSRLFLLQSNSSNGPISDYSAASDSFPHQVDTQRSLTETLASVSRDGSLVAMSAGTNVEIRDRSLAVVKTLSNLGGGVVFDPTQDLFYAANTTQIIAYDTTTWTEVYRFDIGQSVSTGRPFNNGEMAVSDDGTLLFFSTSAGVRVYSLGSPVPGAGPQGGDPRAPASIPAGGNAVPSGNAALVDLVFALVSDEQRRRGRGQ
jgi:hypothetical protein